MASYHDKTVKMARLPVPERLGAVLHLDRNPAVAPWLRRNDVSPAMVVSAAITTLVFLLTCTLPLFLIVLAYCPDHIITASLLLMLPFIAVLSILSEPSRLCQKEERAILRDSALIVGHLSMSLHLSPSLERAMGQTCSQNDDILSQRLRSVQWHSMVDRGSSLVEGIDDLSGSLGPMNNHLRQSLQLLISASAERTRLGVERLLERANELVVQGVREQVDRYVASLSLPTMVLFAFGILLPVMLFSLVPLFSIRVGIENGSSLSQEQTGFLMLAVFPLCSLVYAVNTLERHPLRRRTDWKKNIARKEVFMLLTTLVIPPFLMVLGIEMMVCIALLAILPSLFILYQWSETFNSFRMRTEAEEEFVLALFQIGNRMMSGASLESALASAGEAEQGKHFPVFMRRLLHISACSGRSLEELMVDDEIFRTLPQTVRNAYFTVATSAALDPVTAGRTALNLAKYSWDLRESEVRSRDKLRSVVDMMGYTAMLFAPIVLAITSGLFWIVQDVSGSTGGSDLFMIGAVYVIELCLVVAYFNQNIMGDGDARLVLRRFAIMAPVAEVTYLMASFMAQEGFSSFF